MNENPRTNVIAARSEEKPENQRPGLMLANLAFNILIPVLVLTKMSAPERLGPLWGLVVALIFPFGYGAWDLYRAKKVNFISLLGLVSVLLTGGLALLKLEGIWFAVKEAAIPALIGIAAVVSMHMKNNLLRKILFNPQIFDVERVNRRVNIKNKQEAFEGLMTKATYMFVSSFLLSAILNFILAVVLLKSPTGTPAFNAELGRMTALSFPVIMVPCMVILMAALWYLIDGIKRMTGLELQEILNSPPSKES